MDLFIWDVILSSVMSINSFTTPIVWPSSVEFVVSFRKSSGCLFIVVVSYGSYPHITLSINPIPVVSFANGPIWSKLIARSSNPCLDTIPYVGLNPITPQCDAGFLIEPPVSDPSVISHIFAAIAAAEPPLDPPGICPGAFGLFVGPYIEVSVELPAANSSIFVRPIITPSSSSIRLITVAL